MNPFLELSADERLHSLAGVDPNVRGSFAALMREAERVLGYRPYLSSVLRTCAEQNGLELSRVSGCKSWHLFGRAVDLDVTAEQARELAPFWESIGGTWGGRFTESYGPQGDYVHFQMAGRTGVPEQLCPPGDCDGAVARYWRAWTPAASSRASRSARRTGLFFVVAAAPALGLGAFVARRATEARWFRD